MRRRRLQWVLACLAVLAAGWTGAWLLVAERLRAGIADWADQQRSAGGDARIQRVAIEGFPLVWRIDIDRPLVIGPAVNPWRWEGARAVATLRPWSPFALPLRLEGAQRLRPGPTAPELVVEAAAAAGWVSLAQDGNLSGLALTLDKARLAAPAAWAGATAARLDFAFDSLTRGPPQTDRLAITLTAEKIGLPGQPAPGLGAEIARLELAAEIGGAWPAAGVRCSSTAAARLGSTICSDPKAPARSMSVAGQS